MKGSARRKSVQAVQHAPVPGPAVELAELSGFRRGGTPVVTLRGGAAGVPAASTVPLGFAHLGQRVVVAFEAGDRARPVVLGVLLAGFPSPGVLEHEAQDALAAWVDGERITLAAEREIELRCGKASLTLRADGTIKTKGVNVASTATGQQRIRGASVKIN